MNRNSSKKRNSSSGDADHHPSPGRAAKRRAMHPSNKYAERPPDFNQLASLYPSFSEYVSCGPNKRPRIDWTDFNATRELTRVLLDHDFGIKWWIPDGQLCPTVPNRANYIHWIDDLLSVSPAPWHPENPSQVRGIDIGTGANCIYPLLGAALHGWHFVGTDITPVALDWAKKNLEQNPQYTDCIEIRNAAMDSAEQRGVGGFTEENNGVSTADSCTNSDVGSYQVLHIEAPIVVNREVSGTTSTPVLDIETGDASGESDLPSVPPGGCVVQGTDLSLSEVLENNKPFDPPHGTSYASETIGPSARFEELTDFPQTSPILWGVLKDGERFDFCMCNPPFFENIEEAGLNPRTACGGTSDEMVCPGGELEFIRRIIYDSVRLGTRIQWYTSMVGRKVNVKALTTHLRSVGVTMLRTTEFVQGRTSRWGVAWSFSPVQKAAVLPGRTGGRNKVSFMLESIGILIRATYHSHVFLLRAKGINRQFSAADVLQELSNQLRASGAVTTVDIHSFSLTGRLDESEGQFDVPAKVDDITGGTSKAVSLSFQASVFQQVPGTLLIKASVLKGEGPSGTFSSLLEKVELSLEKHFVKTAHH